MVQLFVDPDKERVLCATDHSGREALIGCGAVLDHFRVAMAAAGWTANVDRFPNPNNLLHLASIDFSPMEFVTDGHRRRARRDSAAAHRSAALRRAGGLGIRFEKRAARRALTIDAVRLDVVPDELRPELAEASQLTESLRLYDSSYHAELTGWTTDFNVTDGHTAELPGLGGRKRSRRRRTQLSRHPAIRAALRSSVTTTPRSSCCRHTTTTHDSMLRCGEMLSAVLLNATMAGLATCTLTHITEVPASRQILSRR